MGGVRTNHTGQTPTLRGLFAAGEAACWDMHGFNRLGGNSVAETVVAGMIVGEFIADFVESPEGELDIPTTLLRETLAAERGRLDALLQGGGREQADVLKAEMQQVMTDRVGIFRTGADLRFAVDRLQELLVRSRDIGLRSRRDGPNPELVTAYRVQKMLKIALCVAHGALTRTESRGAHFREDFPRRNDAEWLKRTLATWSDPQATLPTLNYEALDIARMELPPGWRGYGNKDYTDHPDTPQRAAEVARLRESMTGADRHAVQAALMPYAHLLPPGLQGRNERIDEKLPQ
jgi:fumarate reductase flavoprotein subunit